METYYYVYVLRSRVDHNFYVGYSHNVRKRVEEHNLGEVYSTKRRRPLDLVYWEGCLDKSDALRREKYLKSAWGKRYIKNRLKNYLTGSTATKPFGDRSKSEDGSEENCPRR